MRIYKLNKTVISFKPKAVEFLNGLTSNTIESPRNAFLTIHAKIVASFDQIKISDDEVIAIFEKPFVEQTLSHIDRYMKLSGVQAQVLQRQVYFDLDGDGKLEKDDWSIDQHKGKLVITDRNLETNVKEEDFTHFRLKNDIPVQGIDYNDDFLLNIGDQDYVSFTKGCFLGQEPVAKVHNRSKPSWKLVVCREDECSPEEASKMTSKAIDPDSGQKMGFLFIRND